METGVDAHTSNLKTLEGRNRIVILRVTLDTVILPQKEKGRGGVI